MKHKVLVIDDEIDICEMMRDIISPLGFEVLTTLSASEALTIVEKENVHLIISDIMMPDMTGIDLIKQLRSKSYKYPVVFVSASDADEYLVKALQYGASDFISKPFDSAELIDLVKRLLANVDASVA